MSLVCLVLPYRLPKSETWRACAPWPCLSIRLLPARSSERIDDSFVCYVLILFHLIPPQARTIVLRSMREREGAPEGPMPHFATVVACFMLLLFFITCCGLIYLGVRKKFHGLPLRVD